MKIACFKPAFMNYFNERRFYPLIYNYTQLKTRPSIMGNINCCHNTNALLTCSEIPTRTILQSTKRGGRQAQNNGPIIHFEMVSG